MLQAKLDDAGVKDAEVKGADIVGESNRQVTDHPSKHFTNQADG